MKKIVLLAFLIVTQVGCFSSDIPPANTEEKCDAENRYCINFDKYMNGRDWTKDWTNHSGMKTEFTVSNGESSENSKYARIDIMISNSCSPLLTGSSTMSALPSERGKILWGQIDGRTGKVHGTYPDALCKRPSPTNCPRELWETADCDDLTSGYALCAEHDGKTVVVCISQMTDDRAMAEKIFSTFRWLP